MAREEFRPGTSRPRGPPSDRCPPVEEQGKKGGGKAMAKMVRKIEREERNCAVKLFASLWVCAKEEYDT